MFPVPLLMFVRFVDSHTGCVFSGVRGPGDQDLNDAVSMQELSKPTA